MKILVTNIHSINNAGDRMLLDVVLQQLYAQFPAADITIAMNDPDGRPATVREQREQIVGSFTHWFKTSKRGDAAWRVGALLMGPWLLLQSLIVAAGVRRIACPFGLPQNAARRSLLQSYIDADMVVSCAGNFLYSSGLTGVPFLLAAYAIAYGWLLGKPVYMMPQTIGPLRRRWERLALRWFLRPVQIIMVRDELSLDLLAEIGLHSPQVRLAPDMAFLYTPTADVDASPLLLPLIRNGSPAKRPLLGVTLINWGAQNQEFNGQRRYEAAVAAAIRAFVNETGDDQGYFSGGYTGNIPTRRVAGNVHGQEYVLNAKTTKDLGLNKDNGGVFKEIAGLMFEQVKTSKRIMSIEKQMLIIEQKRETA